MKNSRKVNVIIVTHNSRNFIKKCLKSITNQDYPKKAYSITIVDNNSSDGTPDIVKSFSGIKIFINNSNLGFSKANNIVLNEDDYDYSILLNHDSWVEKDFISQLVKVMEDDSIGVCGGAEHPYNKRIKSSRKTEEVNWVGCGATIFRMKALDDVGLLDENYFMYNEDIDICFRLKFKGWKVFYTPKAIWHHYGWGRELMEGDSRIINSSISRIYFLTKFASLRQMIRSIRLYLNNSRKRPKKPDELSGKRRKIGRQTRKRSIIPKIILFSLPKVIKGLAKRIRIRMLPKFKQKLADKLIRETDKQIY